MIEADLRTYLLTLSAVTTLVGQRIYVDEIPQLADGEEQTDIFPCIVFTVMNETEQTDLDGDGGLVLGQIQIAALSGMKSVARSICEAVRINGTNPGTGLAGYTGTVGTASFTKCVLNDTSMEYWQADDGTDTGLHVVKANYSLWYAEIV